MKKFLITITLLVLMIAACSPEFQGTEAPADEADTAVPTVEPEQSLDPLEEAVVKQLAANLGLKQSDISVVSNEPVEFGDACLGVAMEELSAQKWRPRAIQLCWRQKELNMNITPARMGIAFSQPRSHSPGSARVASLVFVTAWQYFYQEKFTGTNADQSRMQRGILLPIFFQPATANNSMRGSHNLVR